MARFTYKTRGTCSSEISFELGGDGTVRDIRFVDGCNGNLRGIEALTDGMDARAIIAKLKGTPCGRKRTSCPDQFATALEQALHSRCF